MNKPLNWDQQRRSPSDELVAALREHAEPLPAPENQQEFGKYFDRFADAQVVLLGEATHGTSEFYSARAAITRRLIEEHGFTVVAVEADWPDAARIDGCAPSRAATQARRFLCPLPNLDVAQSGGLGFCRLAARL